MADEQSGTPVNTEEEEKAQTQGQLSAEHEKARNAETPLETSEAAATGEPATTGEEFNDVAAPPIPEKGSVGARTGYNRLQDGRKAFYGVHQMNPGDAFGQLIMLISMLFSERGREIFPDMVDFLYPKEIYDDPAQRADMVDRLKEVVYDPNHADRQKIATEFITKHFPHLASGQETLLRPDLLKDLQKPGASELKNHVNLTVDAVNKYNESLGEGAVRLDANLVLNQIYQESRFKADAVGPQTKYGQSMGIAQFLPSTGKKYGLETKADLMNPEKALPAAVKHIGDLTQEFKSQTLAMVAYNGGKGAIKWVAEELGKPISEVTINDWMGYTDHLNKEYGEGASNLWRNQTNEYVALAHSDYWDDAQKAEAEKIMKEMGLPTPNENAEETNSTEQQTQGPSPSTPVS